MHSTTGKEGYSNAQHYGQGRTIGVHSASDKVGLKEYTVLQTR